MLRKLSSAVLTLITILVGDYLVLKVPIWIYNLSYKFHNQIFPIPDNQLSAWVFGTAIFCVVYLTYMVGSEVVKSLYKFIHKNNL